MDSDANHLALSPSWEAANLSTAEKFLNIL
jgi:hypothetical protein